MTRWKLNRRTRWTLVASVYRGATIPKAPGEFLLHRDGLLARGHRIEAPIQPRAKVLTMLAHIPRGSMAVLSPESLGAVAPARQPHDATQECLIWPLWRQPGFRAMKLANPLKP